MHTAWVIQFHIDVFPVTVRYLGTGIDLDVDAVSIHAGYNSRWFQWCTVTYVLALITQGHSPPTKAAGHTAAVNVNGAPWPTLLRAPTPLPTPYPFAASLPTPPADLLHNPSQPHHPHSQP